MVLLCVMDGIKMEFNLFSFKDFNSIIYFMLKLWCYLVPAEKQNQQELVIWEVLMGLSLLIRWTFICWCCGRRGFDHLLLVLDVLDWNVWAPTGFLIQRRPWGRLRCWDPGQLCLRDNSLLSQYIQIKSLRWSWSSLHRCWWDKCTDIGWVI